MKTYLECVREAAVKMNAVNYYNSYQAILDYLRPILQEAADIYASQQGSINTNVSGKQPDYKTIHAAAVEYAINTIEADDKTYGSMSDFEAGAQWALSQVACATAKGEERKD